MNSTVAVFEAIAAAGAISRAELSRLTGFSLMTVGKTVDRLTASGIVTQTKISDGGVGRKAGICSLRKSAGMAIIDLTKAVRSYALDISLDKIAEHSGTDIAELMAKSLGSLFEAGITDIIGVAFIVPDGEREKWHSEISELLQNEPELTVELGRAFAYANSKRFDYSKMALFVRVHSNGFVSGAIMQGGAEYVGANGAGGDISRFISSPDELPVRIAELCALLAPELLHIACDDEAACDTLEKAILDALSKKLGTQTVPQLIVEGISLCRDCHNGAARMLREKYILSKIPNNT